MTIGIRQVVVYVQQVHTSLSDCHSSMSVAPSHNVNTSSVKGSSAYSVKRPGRELALLSCRNVRLVSFEGPSHPMLSNCYRQGRVISM